MEIKSILFLLSLIFILSWSQTAQACVDSGVKAYFAKKNASDSDFHSLVEFVRTHYPVRIEKDKIDGKFFVHAQPEMSKNEAACFAEAWVLLNGENSIGIVWVLDDYKVGAEVISYCDNFFRDLITDFQTENKISEGKQFYQGC